MFDKFKNRDLGLLLLRLGLAAVFINHNFFIKFKIFGVIIHFFGSLGLPPFMAYFVSGVEVVGAVLLILGLFVEVAGVALAIDMAAAMYLTPWTQGFTGHELEFLLGVMALAVAISGAGRYAIPLPWSFKKQSPT